MIGYVVDRDSAFLWETEALRAAPPQQGGAPASAPASASPGDWLTLREASDMTGIPVSTLRKWARRDNVPSYLDETPLGPLRMVSKTGVYDRAEELGRPVNPPPTEATPPAQEVDLTGRERSTSRPDLPEDMGGPEGTMLVPLDAWDKMLNQLGNLHEAGQQLAEARERAARAETEASFLKVRLADMRTELERTRALSADATGGHPLPSASTSETGGDEPREPSEPPPGLGRYTVSLARDIYRRWRKR